MKLSIVYELQECECKCPFCDDKHRRPIFPDCHKQLKKFLDGDHVPGSYVVLCQRCEQKAIAEWNASVAHLKHKNRQRVRAALSKGRSIPR